MRKVYESSVIVPVRMPVALRDRLDHLARVGDTTRNAWIVRTLTKRTMTRTTSHKGGI